MKYNLIEHSILFPRSGRWIPSSNFPSRSISDDHLLGFCSNGHQTADVKISMEPEPTSTPKRHEVFLSVTAVSPTLCLASKFETLTHTRNGCRLRPSISSLCPQVHWDCSCPHSCRRRGMHHPWSARASRPQGCQHRPAARSQERPRGREALRPQDDVSFAS